MWNPDALTIPVSMPTDANYTLSDDIWGMQLLPSGNGVASLGPLVKIPHGSRLDFCGQGFNERTLKVRCGDSFYFVFLQDLDMQRKPASLATPQPVEGSARSIRMARKRADM